jgi:predicted small metal-binding protein
MRALDCPCGLTLTAEDDDALFVAGRVHADEHHADQNISDDFIRGHVRDNARDVDAA